MIELGGHPRGVVLPVRARAGGRRNAITGEREGTLVVSVTQIPENGKANKAIITLLAKLFGCPKSRLELLSGGTSPHKRFLVVDGDPAEVARRVAGALAP